LKLTHVWLLHFLWLLPLAGVGLVVYGRQKKKAMERFADPELLAQLTGQDLKRRRFFEGLFLLTALALMLFALAGPRWGSHYQEVSQKGVDIMILVDVSPSMRVEDIKPDRLERARREILDFLKVIRGDRVGLTAFSGAAFVQCPLTLDYAALDMFLSALQPDLIPVPGTDLGAAIETGVSSFDFKAEADKVMQEAIEIGTVFQVHNYGRQLIASGEKEKALSVRIISICHAVHDFSVKKVYAYLWTIVIECEVLHREDLVGRMVLVSLKGFDEENRFKKASGHLDDLLVIFHFANMEHVFRWHEIRRVALEYLAVSKMNNHLMLCHERSSPSQPLLFGFSSVYSAPCWHSLNRKKPICWQRACLRRHKGLTVSGMTWPQGFLRRRRFRHPCRYRSKKGACDRGHQRKNRSAPRRRVTESPLSRERSAVQLCMTRISISALARGSTRAER